jgi:hypothetical protein
MPVTGVGIGVGCDVGLTAGIFFGVTAVALALMPALLVEIAKLAAARRSDVDPSTLRNR